MPTIVRCRTCGLEYVPPQRPGAARNHCPQCAAPVSPESAVEDDFLRPAEVEEVEKDTVRDGVKLAVLISAIANLVVGFLWGTTCIGLILTGPMVILSVFELILWASAERLSDRKLADRAWTLALFEVGLGVFNTPTLVCGIVTLIYSGRLRDRYDADRLSPRSQGE